MMTITSYTVGPTVIKEPQHSAPTVIADGWSQSSALPVSTSWHCGSTSDAACGPPNSNLWGTQTGFLCMRTPVSTSWFVVPQHTFKQDKNSSKTDSNKVDYTVHSTDFTDPGEGYLKRQSLTTKGTCTPSPCEAPFYLLVSSPVLRGP